MWHRSVAGWKMLSVVYLNVDQDIASFFASNPAARTIVLLIGLTLGMVWIVAVMVTIAARPAPPVDPASFRGRVIQVCRLIARFSP